MQDNPDQNPIPWKVHHCYLCHFSFYKLGTSLRSKSTSFRTSGVSTSVDDAPLLVKQNKRAVVNKSDISSPVASNIPSGRVNKGKISRKL